MGFWQPLHFLIPPPILFTIKGALGTELSGILFVLITRVVSLIGSNDNCTGCRSSSALCCEGTSSSLLWYFLGSIFEPTGVRAEHFVILVRVLPVKWDTRLLSLPVLIATAMQLQMMTQLFI